MPFAPTYDVPAERRAYVELARAENGNGRIGLLMLHGFLGSPLSSHPMANYLAGHGVSVHCPLLPGHGHYPDKLHKITRQAWLNEAQEAFATVQKQYDELFFDGPFDGGGAGGQLVPAKSSGARPDHADAHLRSARRPIKLDEAFALCDALVLPA
jgi:hypothetical protein